MMTVGVPWANWLMGMNDKMIGPQYQTRPVAPNPGVRFSGAPKPQQAIPQPSGPNLRAPQTRQGFQKMNNPTPNWGTVPGTAPLPPAGFNPYEGGMV